MTMCYERWFSLAHHDGITPEGLALCIAARKRFNVASSCKKSLLLHRLLRDEEDRAIVLNEIAEAMALMRVRVMDPGKASVLRATGRPDAPPQDEAKLVADSKLLQDLRKAAQ